MAAGAEDADGGCSDASSTTGSRDGGGSPPAGAAREEVDWAAAATAGHGSSSSASSTSAAASSPSSSSRHAGDTVDGRADNGLGHDYGSDDASHDAGEHALEAVGVGDAFNTAAAHASRRVNDDDHHPAMEASDEAAFQDGSERSNYSAYFGKAAMERWGLEAIVVNRDAERTQRKADHDKRKQQRKEDEAAAKARSAGVSVIAPNAMIKRLYGQLETTSPAVDRRRANAERLLASSPPTHNRRLVPASSSSSAGGGDGGGGGGRALPRRPSPPHEAGQPHTRPIASSPPAHGPTTLSGLGGSSRAARMATMAIVGAARDGSGSTGAASTPRQPPLSMFRMQPAGSSSSSSAPRSAGGGTPARGSTGTPMGSPTAASPASSSTSSSSSSSPASPATRSPATRATGYLSASLRGVGSSVAAHATEAESTTVLELRIEAPVSTATDADAAHDHCNDADVPSAGEESPTSPNDAADAGLGGGSSARRLAFHDHDDDVEGEGATAVAREGDHLGDGADNDGDGDEEEDEEDAIEDEGHRDEDGDLHDDGGADDRACDGWVNADDVETQEVDAGLDEEEDGASDAEGGVVGAGLTTAAAAVTAANDVSPMMAARVSGAVEQDHDGKGVELVPPPASRDSQPAGTPSPTQPDAPPSPSCSIGAGWSSTPLSSPVSSSASSQASCGTMIQLDDEEQIIVDEQVADHYDHAVAAPPAKERGYDDVMSDEEEQAADNKDIEAVAIAVSGASLAIDVGAEPGSQHEHVRPDEPEEAADASPTVVTTFRFDNDSSEIDHVACAAHADDAADLHQQHRIDADTQAVDIGAQLGDGDDDDEAAPAESYSQAGTASAGEHDSLAGNDDHVRRKDKNDEDTQGKEAAPAAAAPSHDTSNVDQLELEAQMDATPAEVAGLHAVCGSVDAAAEAATVFTPTSALSSPVDASSPPRSATPSTPCRDPIQNGIVTAPTSPADGLSKHRGHRGGGGGGGLGTVDGPSRGLASLLAAPATPPSTMALTAAAAAAPSSASSHHSAASSSSGSSGRSVLLALASPRPLAFTHTATTTPVSTRGVGSREQGDESDVGIGHGGSALAFSSSASAVAAASRSAGSGATMGKNRGRASSSSLAAVIVPLLSSVKPAAAAAAPASPAWTLQPGIGSGDTAAASQESDVDRSVDTCRVSGGSCGDNEHGDDHGADYGIIYADLQDGSDDGSDDGKSAADEEQVETARAVTSSSSLSSWGNAAFSAVTPAASNPRRPRVRRALQGLGLEATWAATAATAGGRGRGDAASGPAATATAATSCSKRRRSHSKDSAGTQTTGASALAASSSATAGAAGTGSGKGAAASAYSSTPPTAAAVSFSATAGKPREKRQKQSAASASPPALWPASAGAVSSSAAAASSSQATTASTSSSSLVRLGLSSPAASRPKRLASDPASQEAFRARQAHLGAMPTTTTNKILLFENGFSSYVVPGHVDGCRCTECNRRKESKFRRAVQAATGAGSSRK